MCKYRISGFESSPSLNLVSSGPDKHIRLRVSCSMFGCDDVEAVPPVVVMF